MHIVIKGAGGAKPRTLATVSRTTGVRHAFRFVCALPRGTYRIVARATDLAGNPQVKPGVARLIVR